MGRLGLTRRTRANPNCLGGRDDGNVKRVAGDGDGDAVSTLIGEKAPAYTLPSASCLTPRSGKNVEEVRRNPDLRLRPRDCPLDTATHGQLTVTIGLQARL